jgi:hypothetical protein
LSTSTLASCRRRAFRSAAAPSTSISASAPAPNAAHSGRRNSSTGLTRQRQVVWSYFRTSCLLQNVARINRTTRSHCSRMRLSSEETIRADINPAKGRIPTMNHKMRYYWRLLSALSRHSTKICPSTGLLRKHTAPALMALARMASS